MTTPDAFVGAGWSFPARITASGGVRLSTGTEDIDAAIHVILATAPGERVMRPDFGCAMWEQIYAPLTPTTAGLVEQAAREAIERWEPRIVLDRVQAEPDPALGTINVHVHYRVAATNDRRNLVYPFYVIPKEEAGS